MSEKEYIYQGVTYREPLEEQYLADFCFFLRNRPYETYEAFCLAENRHLRKEFGMDEDFCLAGKEVFDLISPTRGKKYLVAEVLRSWTNPGPMRKIKKRRKK